MAASKKASIGVRTQAAFLTAGTAGRDSGRNDHHSSPDGAAFSALTFTSAGQGAPSSIQRRSAAASSAVSLGPCFGIFASGPATSRINRLSPEAPGLTAGPVSPPSNSRALVVRSRPPRFFAELWHDAQRCRSNGAT